MQLAGKAPVENAYQSLGDGTPSCNSIPFLCSFCTDHLAIIVRMADSVREARYYRTMVVGVCFVFPHSLSLSVRSKEGSNSLDSRFFIRPAAVWKGPQNTIQIMMHVVCQLLLFVWWRTMDAWKC